MKSLKYFLSIAAITGALILSAKANVIVDLGSGSVANQGHPDLIVAAANAIGVDSGVLPDDMDVIYGGRVADNSNGGTLTNSFGTFTVTTSGSMQENSFLTFTMNPGFVLAGVALHAGGGSSDEFFSINDETSGILEGPFSNGKTLSNFDILVEEGGHGVPDGGTTAMLLGGALTGLGLVRRYLKG
jgi:hypothetical protein